MYGFSDKLPWMHTIFIIGKIPYVNDIYGITRVPGLMARVLLNAYNKSYFIR